MSRGHAARSPALAGAAWLGVRHPVVVVLDSGRTPVCGASGLGQAQPLPGLRARRLAGGQRNPAVATVGVRDRNDRDCRCPHRRLRRPRRAVAEFTPGRSGGDLYDWIADALGATVGAALTLVPWCRRRCPPKPATRSPAR